jgi:methyl-accepting chemotaxis protein
LPQTDEEARLWREFVPAWQAWHQANTAYLELNRQIDINGITDPEHLGRQLEQFIKDHYVLAMRVMEMLFVGGPVFTGGEDAAGCDAGKWMATYQTTNDDLLVNMASIRSKHLQFHDYIHTLKQLVSAGKYEEARLLYKNDMEPLMQNTIAYFKTMLITANDSITLVNQGKELLLGTSRQQQDTALALLERIVQINQDVAGQVTRHAAEQASFFRTLTLVAVMAGLILSIVFGVLSSRNIARPLGRVSAHLQHMSQGDFSVEVHEKDLLRRDEIGVLSHAAEVLTGSMCTIIGNIHNGIATLTSSSTGLAAVSEQMKSSVVDMSNRTMSAAAAAEESSVNSHSVAAGMEQATRNLSTVASATEQMSATISEIAGNAEQVRAISDEASRQADAVTAMMRHLGTAAQEIGKVTETITTISEQTNLLALNATIEAAHAGDAGLGFAVVANEIKELARQTSGATKDIRGRIEAICSSTVTAMGGIDRIAGVIKTVNEIVPQMTVAIEEQAVVTQDVAKNIAQATTGVADSNEQVMQTALVSVDIAGDIATISASVAGVRAESDQVELNAAEMLTLAGQLKAIVADFKMCKERSAKREEAVHGSDSLVLQKVSVGMGGYEAVETFA